VDVNPGGVLLLDSEGKERVRMEGYLPKDDFMAGMESGLGLIAFVHKKHAGCVIACALQAVVEGGSVSEIRP